jgi:hypothetical protein
MSDRIEKDIAQPESTEKRRAYEPPRVTEDLPMEARTLACTKTSCTPIASRRT